MWHAIDNPYKLLKYRPSSEKDLAEAPGLKYRKILPIVSVSFCHDKSDRVFKVVAHIKRIKEKVGATSRIVEEKWVYSLQTPEQVSARETLETPTSDPKRFHERLKERFGEEFSTLLMQRLEDGIAEAIAERVEVTPPRKVFRAAAVVARHLEPESTVACIESQADIISRILKRKT